MRELESWKEEQRSAYLYRAVAEAEKGTTRASLFLELAHEAEKQGGIWARRVREAAGDIPEGYIPDLRARLVARLVRRFGVRRLRGVLSAMKVRGMSLYAVPFPKHIDRSRDDAGRRSRIVETGGNLRAAVFGVNDGLISNASLIMGIAGATASHHAILTAGAAGLVAGAFSMAAGEYVSMRSQREMYEHQISLEREELDHYPEAEAEELALIYQERGLPREEALSVAKRIVSDPEQALTILAREELGLNPDDLGSPWGAAVSSFGSFTVGAAIPLAPFALAGGNASLPMAIAASGIALFAVGSVLSLFTGRNMLVSGARMLLIGAAAGGVTFLVGRLLGVAIG
jgi:VIT1/CCC1 family predicted Fe2+/Mn2+ transporter